MPNNIDAFRKRLKRQMRKQVVGPKPKAKTRPKNKIPNKLHRDLGRAIKGGDGRDADQIIVGPVADIHAMVGRRLMELLQQNTPKLTGELTGGWTSSSTPPSGARLNLKNFLTGDEIGRIVKRAEGHLTIDLSNAVEYAAVINYGLNGHSARRFCELAIAQLKKEVEQMGAKLIVTGHV